MNKQDRVEKFLQLVESKLDEQNISVPKFAKMMGVPRVTVYTWLNRTSVMSLEKYFRAIDALNLDVKYIEKEITA